MVDSGNEKDDAFPGGPPSQTLREIDAQNTPALRVEARGFAEARVRCIRGVGQPITRDYATELVDDAITNTWLGISRWNPESCSLLVHVRNVIMDRTSKEIRRARRFPHVPIHVVANDSSDAAQVEHGLTPDGSGSPIELVGLIFRVASELKAIACDDVNAGLVLSCWNAGVVERDDVMARTGLTPAAYKAARKRLLSLSRRLPPDLFETAHELLRSAA